MTNKRGQRGSLRIESGATIGYWNEYITDAQTGERKRKQRCIRLGPKDMGRFEAYEVLRKHIERSAGTALAPMADGSVSLTHFIDKRWLPLREAKWRPSTKSSAEGILSHIKTKFGTNSLESLDKVSMQTWLNKMAQDYSKSVVLHCLFYLRSICDEAVEQDYLAKNPAKRLEAPRTKRVEKAVLTVEQFNAVIAELKEPYSLLIRVGAVCALRPSELLALRWRDLDSTRCTFTIRETIYRGVLRDYTKTTESDETDSSLITVSIPDLLVQELLEYRGPRTENDLGWEKEYSQPNNFIFANKERGNFLHKENILHRVLKPVREKLGLPVLNFQVLRRTMATLSQRSGSVKDVQAHLRHKTPDVTASEYMQSVPESARKMVNSVYAELVKQKA